MTEGWSTTIKDRKAIRKSACRTYSFWLPVPSSTHASGRANARTPDSLVVFIWRLPLIGFSVFCVHFRKNDSYLLRARCLRWVNQKTSQGNPILRLICPMSSVSARSTAAAVLGEAMISLQILISYEFSCHTASWNSLNSYYFRHSTPCMT